MENRANTTAKKMVKDLAELMCRPKSEGLGMAAEPLKPKTADQGKMALSMAAGEGHGGQGQVEPRSRSAGRRRSAPTAAGQAGRRHEPQTEPPAAPLVHGEGAEAGEGQLADGHVPAPAGERDQREADQAEGEADARA